MLDTRNRVLIGFILIALAGLALSPTASAAAGATLRVTVTTDTDATGTGACASGGSCSLREAVKQADSASGDTIMIPAGTYTLTPANGPLVLSSSVTVSGAGVGATMISGDSDTRIFTVSSPATVTMSDLDLENGNPSAGLGGAMLISSGASVTMSACGVNSNFAPGGGGGVASEGKLVMVDCTVSGNSTEGSGGGLMVANVTTGTATNASTAQITGTTFSNNAASGSGGGIVETNTATDTNATESLTITNSTLSSNATGSRGGGVADSAGSRTGALSVTNSTITGNSATARGGGVSVGDNPSAATFLSDTIAANSAGGTGGTGGTGGDIDVGTTEKPSFEDTIVATGTAKTGPDCDGVVSSAGHNLDDAAGCGFSMTSDLTKRAPKLGSLQDNGGPTETMELGTGSAAAGTGGGPGVPATDQRGVARPQGGEDDIGALESAPPILGPTVSLDATATGVTVAVLVTNPDVSEGVLTFQYGPTMDYGSATPIQIVPANLTAGSESATLANLAPGTLYHYRAVVVDADGATYGPDESFQTTSAQPLVTQPSNRFTLGRFGISSRGTLTAALGIPAAGRFSAKATFSIRRTVITGKGKRRKVKHVRSRYTYGAQVLTSTGAATGKIAIAPTKVAARLLAGAGPVKVTISVTFKPAQGTASAKSTTVTLRRGRQGKFGM